MTYPPAEENGSGADRARFSGLTRQQVEVYVRLPGAVESDPATVPLEIDEDLKAGLLSGETVRIRDAASRLQREEAEADQPIHQPLREALAAVLSNPQQLQAQRLSAGDALAHIGDPRFHDESGYFLPHDEMLGFVEIPAGPFRMGSDPEQDPEAKENEQPQHTLNLDTFYMARYPVTVAQFRLFVEKSGHEAVKDSLQGLANHPVRWVSWHDAIAYCRWLTNRLREQDLETPLAALLREGWSVMLPSEAEWEKAVRGSDSRIYPWGSTFDADRANHKGLGLGSTSSVGCFQGGASGYGLLDMAGNVWEWTRSEYGGYPYKAEAREKLDSSADRRVLRGGSYNSNAALRCAYRIRDYPHYRPVYSGFRVCASPFAIRHL